MNEDEDEKVTEPAIPAAPDPMRFARAGYEGYFAHTMGKTFDGRDMPTWDALPDRIRDAWAAGANRILIECTRGGDHVLDADIGKIDVNVKFERDPSAR